MPARILNSLPIGGAAIVCLFCLVCCDSSFEPFSENRDKPFSLNGFLDTSADTQWVRVMPVRQSYIMGPEEIDARVILEHSESGESVTMEDSLIQYGEAYAWNFWSVMEIKPETRYRIIAERSDGAVSRADVSIPEDFPQPIMRIDPFGPDVIRVSGTENRVLVDEVYHLEHKITGQQRVVHEPVKRYFTIPSNSYEWLEISRSSSASFGENTDILEFYVLVAAMSADWPDGVEIDEELLAIPEETSNVENGIGYVGGVVGKKVPYKSCWDENGQYIACPEDEGDE